ncbi:glycosyltransferase family 4 protein [Flavobacterium caseinilyticum]|uniref:Glycosyltransferase n=1 Tax=Flavobacterium caseinilyticum TaxID=2541732 RepID=A0A4R5AYU6_9FLAO|nr:glycosyltransferase family 4 protein [Flavobacterium caseinilyticum]TDD77016.1 glycosyltransferase [Flavobacterium caseinilyticum]
MKKLKVVVYHVGARDKYSIANYFADKQMLHALITDYWFKLSRFMLFGRIREKANRRFSESLQDDRVYSYPFVKIIKNLWNRSQNLSADQIWILHDKAFTSFALQKMKKLKPDVLYGYTNASLEVLEYYKNHKNVLKIHNQIDPGLIYYEIKRELNLLFPELEKTAETISLEFIERIKKEWELADCIIVNSEYSKKSLSKYVSQDKVIEILPLIYDRKKKFKTFKREYSDRLNVGFVGNISVIKGFNKFIDVAKNLNSEMNFIAVGTFLLNDTIMEETKSYITYTGHLTIQGMQDIYKTIDVLVFPTYCDGFGMVQLEAMDNGIPVLASRYCGEVVIDNYNGNIIETADDIINVLSVLNNDRYLLQKYSENAFETINNFSQEKFELRFNLILEKYLS